MVARDGTGPKIAREVTSCAECLAWGMTYAQGVCVACYNFAAHDFGQDVGVCGACGRRVRLKKGYCRLCWHQAREDRAVLAEDARSKVEMAPYLPEVRCHQLFLAGMTKRRARPRAFPRRYGAKGRPHKPPPPIAIRPPAEGAQLALFTDLPRTYRYGRIDRRTRPAPDNPWLAWALYLAHAMAETRGFDSVGLGTLNRNLVMLLATHADGDKVRVSDIHHVITNRGGGLTHVLDVMSTMGILVDDRPPVFDAWLASKLDDLAPGIAEQVSRWAYVLHDGTPRRKPRHHATATGYVNSARPALLAWSQSYGHLREVTRDDVLAYLDTLYGESRAAALTALRSLFTWAKRDGVIFRNPATRIHLGKRALPVWQRLSDDEIAQAVGAASSPQAKLYVALAAVHAARNGQIRAIQLDDVDLGNRRLTIAGRSRPLDELTYRLLVGWLDYRRSRWPHTANRHLLVSSHSAIRLGQVSATWILDLRGTSVTLERLRIDRQLEEAIVMGADPLHLAAVFGVSTAAAIRYATNARQLLDDHHAATSPGTLGTQAPGPADAPEEHLGSD